MNRLISLLALLFFLPAAASAATTTSAPASTYDIEIVVFENRMPELEGGEVWIAENLEPLVKELAEAGAPETPSTDYALADSVSTLSREGRYRVLAHQRWTQTAEARSATKAVRLQSADQMLDGVFRFYLSRFLHVDMNLVLSDGQVDWKSARPEEIRAHVYRLAEHRRVKTQELNYFDHPRLGVLVRVTQAGKTQ